MPKKANVYSGRALAKKCGVNEKSIRNAYNNKLLVRIVKGTYRGKYDLADPINERGIEVIKTNPQSGTKLPKKETTPNTKMKQVEPIIDLEKIGDMGLLNLQKVREVIREKQINNRKKRGELVDRKAVSKIFNRLWSVDSSQLVPIATKLAPEIASICGVEDPEVITKVREKIDTEIWGVLGHCKRIMSDYLDTIEADNLEEE